MTDASIVWHRLDLPGHDHARLWTDAGRWHLAGVAVFAHDAAPCRLEYDIVCDDQWRTTAARVTGWMGREAVRVELAVDDARRWRMNGTDVAQVAGCLDVDLGFTPSTNLLPIRRLELAVGDSAAVRAAWLGFPTFVLQPLEQVYRRSDPMAYEYVSAGGAFRAELMVNAAGFVTRYGSLWRADAEG